MNSFREENSEDRLAQLYQLLGSAVLLPVDLGTKAPTLKGWQAITFDDTQHPDYQRELLAVIRRGGNLGVRLGPLSDRLIDLDIDNDGELDNLIKRCPWLTGTLQTKGQRGRHFFVRLSGDCEFPNGKSVYPLTEGSKKIGELRLGGSGGAQSVIYGVHPDGMRYQILVNRPPLVISLADLDELAPGVIFKDDIVPTRPAATHTAVAKTEASQKPGNVDVVKRARAYLAAMPPSVEKQNGDDQLFKAACVLVNGYNLSPEEALPILEEYNSRAEPRWPEQRLRYKLSEALKVGPPAGKMRGYLLDDTDRQPSQGKIFGEKLAREFQEAEGGSNRQLEADNNLPLDLEKETERQIERYTSDPELFPEPMRPEAFHGVIGQIAQLMSQHCESSLEVLLLHGLVIIGNIAGRSAYVYGGGPKLFPNEFSVFVGETARGRKGTAYTMWEHLAQMVNPDWFEGCLSGQMQTGEGIVHRIRDERYGIPLGKKKKGEPVEEVLLDAGVSDKRLLIVEEEFSHSLKMAQRNGNTLSETVRRAWDSPHSLRTDNKNSPLKASDPHVSLIGHSTRDELLTTLGKVDLNNGMANRVLWCAARRTGDMPNAEFLDWNNHPDITEGLKRVFRQRFPNTSEPAFFSRSPETKNYWNQLYCKLNGEKRSSTIDVVLARDTSHILKLSLIFAITDLSQKIEREHIEAALAVADFCRDSARWIFGQATGNQLANNIIWALRRAATAGLTREQINSDVCYRNTPKSKLDRALGDLVRNGLAKMKMEQNEMGRPAERWFTTA